MSSPRKRVFFLTYYFPPLGGIAALRNAKMARYLADFGWDAEVFHAGDGTTAVRDESLVKQLPASIHRFPVRTLEAAFLHKALHATGLRYFSYKIQKLYLLDPQIGWLPNLLRKVKKEIGLRGKPDAFFTSSAPFSINIAGLYLRNHFDIPWVSDYQDEWTQNNYIQWPTPLHRKLAVDFEAKTMSTADGVITVTPPLVTLFQKNRPAAMQPVRLVRDGYDEADFQSAPPPKLNDKWTLAHVGTAYLGSDPRPMLDCLVALIQSGRIDGSKVRVVQVGRGDMNWPKGAAFEKMETGFLPHAEAVAWMRKSHALIILRKEASASSGKIYEYMRSGTPVIAVAPIPSEVAELLSETNTGRAFSPSDRQALSEEFVFSYQQWEKGTGPERRPTPALEFYSRRAQTRTLADLLDAVSKPRT